MKPKRRGVKSGRAVSVYLSIDLAEALATVSFNQRVSVTYLVEQLLVEGMDRSQFAEFRAAAYAYREVEAQKENS